MNERIDELMIQAGARFEMMNWVHYDDFEYKKFAELIVKECAKAAYLYASDSENYEHYDDNGWDCLPGDLQSHIKQHFGVDQ
jgi:hypothetical protein